MHLAGYSGARRSGLGPPPRSPRSPSSWPSPCRRAPRSTARAHPCLPGRRVRMRPCPCPLLRPGRHTRPGPTTRPCRCRDPRRRSTHPRPGPFRHRCPQRRLSGRPRPGSPPRPRCRRPAHPRPGAHHRRRPMPLRRPWRPRRRRRAWAERCPALEKGPRRTAPGQRSTGRGRRGLSRRVGRARPSPPPRTASERAGAW
jgi:hypothetical protein